MVKAFFQWLVEEEVLSDSPIAKASMSVDPVLDHVREIVVPDFRFIDLFVGPPRADRFHALRSECTPSPS
jgi:hypothetical protein